jgi:hypothetical protein
LGCELKDVGFRETILADGSEKVLISIKDAGLFEDID